MYLRKFILPFSILIIQIWGFNFINLTVFVFGSFFSFKFSRKLNLINFSLIVFILLSLVISIFNLLYEVPDFYSIEIWGQFYFVVFLFFLSNNHNDIYKYLCFVVTTIFILDFITNLFFLFGINIFNINVDLSIRQYETYARFPGIKGNTLYTSMISFLTFCIFLNKRKWFLFIFICSIINLMLSGSYRFIYVSLIVFAYSSFCYMKFNRFFLILLYFVCISIPILLNVLPSTSNPSNLLRLDLWINSLYLIAKSPFIGYGIFAPNTNGVFANYYLLKQSGVTESFILLVTYCFGLPVLFFFLIYLIQTFLEIFETKFYNSFSAIFIGLSIELFIGGSIFNTLALLLFITSSFLIHEKRVS